MKILLTGPDGQIGWELTRALRPLGEVIGVDRSMMDLTDAAAMRRVVRELSPDVIISAAGYTAVDKAESEPDLARIVNADAPGILAEEAARIGAVIVHYSTDYVFDGSKGSPYAPTDAPNPINVYGHTKLAGERAIASTGARAVILRTSWVYSMRRSNFMLTMLRLAAAQNELRVVDDQHGCPSWSRLIAQGTADILSRSLQQEDGGWSFGGKEGIHHLACNGSTTWFELARHILQSAAIDPMPTITPIRTEEYSTAADRPRYSVLDCTGTVDVFGVDLGPWRSAVVAALREKTPARRRRMETGGIMDPFSRLAKRQEQDGMINVAVTGAGLMGRGMVYQINRTPGMRTSLIVNRTPQRAVESYVLAGCDRSDVIVSDDTGELQRAVNAGQPAVTQRAEMLRDLSGIDVVVEVTGAVEYGAEVALFAIDGGKHIIMMNAETDATVGCALKKHADEAGLVYSNSDGDQPGVLKRLCSYVSGIGFEIVAAVNCKGFMDTSATPDSIRPWAEKQNTSLSMTTAFTDGTKMNIENAVLANATGLVPELRGMHGVETNLAHALGDCMSVFGRRGLVDYTLGGDFKGGVFVIGYGEDPVMIQPYMKYLKMGEGPNYIFYRPYHLCHYETPLSIAEAALDHEPTIAPLGTPIVEVITIAKKDLRAGESLDGIGGYTCYGEIDTVDRARGLLPVGLTDNATVTRDIARGEPIPLDSVELPADSTLARLRLRQNVLIEAATTT